VTSAGTAREILSFPDILAATNGRIVAQPRGSGGISSAAADSRAAAMGSLFVALPGERTDGHEFLRQAAESGASVLLVAEAQAVRRAAELDGLSTRHGTGIVAVSDTLAALQKLARFHMERLSSVTRVGVTGSNGKTTTKEIIGSILSRAAPTAMNEGNLNSEIGLPIACLTVAATHRYAVLEMGMNHAGEMDVLADIVHPDAALITNIGTAHIGLLGSQDAIAAEKKKIFKHFDGRQTGFIEENGQYRSFLSEGVRGRIITFGAKSTPGFEGSESRGLGGTLIHWEGSPVRFPLFGPHNLANALGSISVARELGVSSAVIREGLESVTPLFGRSQVVEGPVTVIVDCYNANPDSMDQSIAFFQSLPWKGRRIAVLGSMRELGEESERAHAELGRRLRQTAFDAVFLFGEEMEQAWTSAAGSAVQSHGKWLTSLDELGSVLGDFLRTGDIVLLKGSRGLEMERLLPRITDLNRGIQC
jgi:UDP-N-acetylmuramoyl-tripeptide--D-alanyl-D-alanine ligase